MAEGRRGMGEGAATQQAGSNQATGAYPCKTPVRAEHVALVDADGYWLATCRSPWLAEWVAAALNAPAPQGCGCRAVVEARAARVDFACSACEGVLRSLVSRLPAPAAPPVEPYSTCNECGGTYRYDTTLDNEVWNAVMRPDGKEHVKELLCFACIVRRFVLARNGSFDVTLHGNDFATSVPLSVVPTATARVWRQQSADLATLRAHAEVVERNARVDAELLCEAIRERDTARADLARVTADLTNVLADRDWWRDRIWRQQWGRELWLAAWMVAADDYIDFGMSPRIEQGRVDLDRVTKERDLLHIRLARIAKIAGGAA